MRNHPPLARTEEAAPPERSIDALSGTEALALMLERQIAALNEVRGALPEIEAAADLVAETVRAGGTLVYAAAGSSGLMALADAAELPGTFGIPRSQVRIAMAGGVPTDADMPGDTEDETDTVADLVAALGKGDLVIALSASGTTPFPCAVAERARARDVRALSIANNPGTRLLALADVAVCLPTPPEALAGSTRLGAGTAQKVALNMISTLAGVRLGHVFRGRMVNLMADNAKLRDRAARIVSDVAGVSIDAAREAIATCEGATKPAILVARGASVTDAWALLDALDGHLAPALGALHKKTA